MLPALGSSQALSGSQQSAKPTPAPPAPTSQPARVIHSARSIGDHTVVDRCRAAGTLVQMHSSHPDDAHQHAGRVSKAVDAQTLFDPTAVEHRAPESARPPRRPGNAPPSRQRRPGGDAGQTRAVARAVPAVEAMPAEPPRSCFVSPRVMSRMTAAENERCAEVLTALMHEEDRRERALDGSFRPGRGAGSPEDDFLAKARVETQRKAAEQRAAKAAERKRIALKGIELHARSLRQSSPGQRGRRRRSPGSAEPAESPRARSPDGATAPDPLLTPRATRSPAQPQPNPSRGQSSGADGPGRSPHKRQTMSDRIASQALGRGVHREVKLRFIELKRQAELREDQLVATQRAEHDANIARMQDEYERLVEAAKPPAPPARASHSTRRRSSVEEFNRTAVSDASGGSVAASGSARGGDLFHLTATDIPDRAQPAAALTKEDAEYERRRLDAAAAQKRLAAVENAAFGPHNPPPFFRALAFEAPSPRRARKPANSARLASTEQRLPTDSFMDSVIEPDLGLAAAGGSIENARRKSPRHSALDAITSIQGLQLPEPPTPFLRSTLGTSDGTPRASRTPATARSRTTATATVRARNSRAARSVSGGRRGHRAGGLVPEGEDVTGRPAVSPRDGSGDEVDEEFPWDRDERRIAAARERKAQLMREEQQAVLDRIESRQLSITSTGANVNYTARHWAEWIVTTQAARIFANAIAARWNPFDEAKRHRALFHPPRGDARVRELTHASRVISQNLFLVRLQHSRDKKREAAQVLIDIFLALRSSPHRARWAVHMFLTKIRYLQRAVRRMRSLRADRVNMWTRQYMRTEPRIIRMVALRADPETVEAEAAQAVRERLQKEANAPGNTGGGLGTVAQLILKRTAEGGRAKLADLRTLERDQVAVARLERFESLETLRPMDEAHVRQMMSELYHRRSDEYRRQYHEYIRAQRAAKEREMWSRSHGRLATLTAAAAAAAANPTQSPSKEVKIARPTMQLYLRQHELVDMIFDVQSALPENAEARRRMAAGKASQRKSVVAARTETTDSLLKLVNLLTTPVDVAPPPAAPEASLRGAASVRLQRHPSMGTALAASRGPQRTASFRSTPGSPTGSPKLQRPASPPRLSRRGSSVAQLTRTPSQTRD